MSDDTYELPPMCVTPDGRCEEGDGPPGADSSTPRDTQGESPQGEALNGQARHAGNAETRWRALTSYPDFCQVGDKIVGFDSSGPLGNPVNYSPNVITAGQRTYRVGDLCQGTESNAGSGVGSGTSQGSGHVLFLTGHDNVKANGQPVVRDGSECMVNCNAAGAGGAKGYVHTNTESVNSQPEESSEPLTEAELFQQQGEANLERVGELRDALHDNPNGKTAAEAEALYAEVQQLASETRAQQDALMDALREGRISGNDYIESSFEVDEAANRAAGMQQEAERQVRYTSESGRNIRAAGVFMAEAATPYGTIVDIQDTMALWGEGRVLAASGMTLLTAVSVIPGVGLLRKADDVVDIARNTDRAGDAAGSANRGGTSGSNEGLRVEQNSTSIEGKNSGTEVRNKNSDATSMQGKTAPKRVRKSGGRSGKQARLKEMMNDPKVGSADRGWLKNDARHIEYGNKSGLRIPRNGRNSPGRKAVDKGYELAHPHNAPASKGNNYAGSKLKNHADHKVETRLHRHRY
ncbi:hypothetical protein [Vreelandella titanicae]|uniref:hypothetical protein n=1 Tax=Vreelandella titanicae TaxID=664683 RepID=UPI001680EAD9|nr:hypothetical protein [Halomonas titanicae]QNU64548.1 hypothetical protein HZS52_09560 [Halomonas titanicae]